MSELRYNLQFNKLCNVLKLGRIIGSPEPISGGLLHKMFSVETLQGKYANDSWADNEELYKSLEQKGLLAKNL